MMNQEDIFKKIGQILNELNEQYQYLAQNPAELNELELELFLANSSFLSDHVQIIRKLNSKSIQKAIPEHTSEVKEIIEQQPVIPYKVVEETHDDVLETPAHKPVMEEEIFKIDKEPSTFEFILNDKPSTDKFEFEEKSVDEIFDRPLSKEEEQIIAQKQKLRELDSLGSELPEDDEIGPEPFLVSEPAEEETELEEAPAAENFTAEKQDHEEPAGQAPDEEAADVESADDSEDEAIEEDVIAEADAEQDRIEGNLKEEPATAVTEQQPEVPKADDEPVKQSESEQPKSKPTLNDILSGNAGKPNFNTGTTRTPVTDLKQAISLNDKMRYIKDLFNGYNLAYAEAIDLLNKMPDFKTADVFLQNNYAVKNNWAAKQETAEQFYELLNQRFPAK